MKDFPNNKFIQSLIFQDIQLDFVYSEQKISPQSASNALFLHKPTQKLTKYTITDCDLRLAKHSSNRNRTKVNVALK